MILLQLLRLAENIRHLQGLIDKSAEVFYGVAQYLVDQEGTPQSKELIEGLKDDQAHVLEVQDGNTARVSESNMLTSITAIKPSPSVQPLLDHAEEGISARGGAAIYQDLLIPAQRQGEGEEEEVDE